MALMSVQQLQQYQIAELRPDTYDALSDTDLAAFLAPLAFLPRTEQVKMGELSAHDAADLYRHALSGVQKIFRDQVSFACEDGQHITVSGLTPDEAVGLHRIREAAHILTKHLHELENSPTDPDGKQLSNNTAVRKGRRTIEGIEWSYLGIQHLDGFLNRVHFPEAQALLEATPQTQYQDIAQMLERAEHTYQQLCHVGQPFDELKERLLVAKIHTAFGKGQELYDRVFPHDIAYPRKIKTWLNNDVRQLAGLEECLIQNVRDLLQHEAETLDMIETYADNIGELPTKSTDAWLRARHLKARVDDASARYPDNSDLLDLAGVLTVIAPDMLEIREFIASEPDMFRQATER